MKHYALIDERGVVIGVQTQDASLPVPPGALEIPEPVSGDLFAKDGKLVPRIDYSIDALPLPCKVIIDGVEYDVTEQPTFEFDAPGTYLITVEPDDPKFMTKVFEYDYQP